MTDKTDTTALVIAEELNEWARDYAPTELATALATCAAVLLKNQNTRIAELEALQAAPPAPAAVAVPDERDAYIHWLTSKHPDVYTTGDAMHWWGHGHVSALAWQARASLTAAQAQGKVSQDHFGPVQEHATQLAGQGQEKCVCTFAQRVVGDGCRHCNPQEYIDRLHKCLHEYREEADAPAQAQEDARALEAPAAPEWERVRRGLSMMMMGFASTPGKPLQAAEAALDAATEPGMPLACLRALAAAPQAPEVDALDHAELQEILRAVDQFADCGETDVDYALLMRAAQAGYLECTHFQVMNESALNLDAARAAQGGA